MNYLTDTRELIIALKKVKEERKLNLDQITKIVYDADPANAPSRSCIATVFKEGSEDNASHFRFDVTLKPICNALLDINTIMPNESAEDTALKSLARYKMDLLEKYAEELKKAQEELKNIKEREHKKYEERIAKETKQFHDSISFAMEQIKLKDERIDKHMAEKERLISMMDDVIKTNNALVRQMMEYPIKKGCEENGNN